tara:strand:- start:54 stop:437 length:384 start_codon:yes stop_codon:yes gene_type:complete
MAQAFKRYTNRYVGTSQSVAIGTTYIRIGPNNGAAFGSSYITATTKAAIIVGLTLCNITSGSIKASVKLSDDDASNACWIALNVPIPAGDTIELIQGKLVLEQDDSVYVASDTATSLDVVMSVLLDV